MLETLEDQYDIKEQKYKSQIEQLKNNIHQIKQNNNQDMSQLIKKHQEQLQNVVHNTSITTINDNNNNNIIDELNINHKKLLDENRQLKRQLQNLENDNMNLVDEYKSQIKNSSDTHIKSIKDIEKELRYDHMVQ